VATTCTDKCYKHNTKQALQYKEKRQKHVQRMDKNRLLKQTLQYKKKWQQQIHSLDKTRPQKQALRYKQ